MVVTAVAGALGFLTRLPVGRSDRAWAAFRSTPVAFPVAGYVVGAVLATPFALGAPAPTTAFAFVVLTYVLTGVTHLDGVADVGDALAVHGDRDRRRHALADPGVGAGGVLAAAIVVVGLGTAGLALADLPRRAALLVVTAEVTAKASVAALVALGSPAHEGLGSAFATRAGPRELVPVLAVAAPAALVAWPGTAGVVAALAGVAGTVAIHHRVCPALGGVSGDVLGASNEVVRVLALHAGVVAWTLS